MHTVDTKRIIGSGRDQYLVPTDCKRILYCASCCTCNMNLNSYFVVEAEKDDEKENIQADVHGKRPIKTSRRKGRQLTTGKSDTRTTTSSDQNQARQSSQGSVSEEMNLIEMTSMLKDLHSLSTALLTVDKENGDDSQQSL